MQSSILIVDDDANSRIALRELLQGPGRDAVVAQSGEDALRLVLKQDFAAILLDVKLPRMDGFETARLIRERERSRHTPIIFLTGAYEDQPSMFRGYEAGAVDYIVKPPNLEILKSKVSIFVELYRKNALLRQEIADRTLIESRLRASEQSLHALAAHLQSVREEERARISREIHDELGQVLTGVKIELTWVAKRLPQEHRLLTTKVESVLRLIDDSIRSVRKIASGLRPALSDQLGLVAAVEWQAKDFRKRTGIRCKLVLPADLPQLDHERAAAMFRVLQELLTNVSRHAGATRIEVVLRVDANALTLSVEDNGKGFGDTQVFDAKSLGFLGMRERILPFGGQIEIDGMRRKGSKVSVSVPIGPGSP